MSTETILITGGNGNLGRLVADDFETRGYKVVAFDLPGTEDVAPKHRAVVTGDIRDQELLEEILDEHKPSAVIHLASLLSGSSEANPQAAWEINATASINLMHMAKERGIGPFVFSSTIATCGPGGPKHLSGEIEQWPDNVYGATKIAVERMGVWLKQSSDFDFRCLRFPMVLSPSSPPGALTAYPGHAFRAAAKGEAFAFPVSASTGMSTLHLNDVTRSIVELALADRARLKHHAYNLHGFMFTTGELADTITAQYPDASFSYDPNPMADARIAGWPDTIDDTAAREDWDWAPEYDYEKCVAAMFALVRAEHNQH